MPQTLVEQLVESITKNQDRLYERLTEYDDVVLFTSRQLRNAYDLRFTTSEAAEAVIHANTKLERSSVLIAVRYDDGNGRFLASKPQDPT